ncbi:MAG: peptidoglycan-associated lipoprotein Pal [Candidatus Binatia bacterium]
MKSIRSAGFGVMVVVMAMALVGCPAKKRGVAEGPGGLGEGAIGGGSLDRFKEGMEPGEGGPLNDVHFDYDRYDLDSEARSVLQTNADWLRQNSNARVEVEGHCDERGTVEYNLALGAKRAKAARDYLVSLGISSDRLSTISYGEELPLCRETNESCWARNRRSHFVVLQ